MTGPPVVIPGIAEDGSLYPIEKMEAHRRGAFHQAVSVFVFSPEGELLVQRRAAGKYHCGGQWANSCCTHPHWGESPGAAAGRRLGEELGLTLPLTAGGVLDYAADVTGGLYEHERVHVFRASADRAVARPDPDPGEVDAVLWAAPDWLRLQAAADPARFTPWFRIYLDRWDELGLG